MLLATHSTEEALELCDRVAILDHGVIRAVGTTQQIARKVGDDVYRIWTRDPDHRTLRGLGREEVIKQITVTGEVEDGWHAVDVVLAGGQEEAAHVLAYLVESGMPIARYERRDLSLADLIERVVQGQLRENADA